MDEPQELLWNFVVCGFVFISLAGFSLLESGVSQKKHGEVILLKNILQIAIGMLVFYFVGYAFSMGEVDEKFIGKNLFGGDEDIEDTKHYLKGVMYGLFGMLTVFTVNGTLTGRAQLYVYILTSLTIMSFIYPVVAAWRWGQGWLVFWDDSLRDYGGAASIHLLGSTMGGVAIRIIHPRLGRFTKSKIEVMVGNATYLITTKHSDFEWGQPELAGFGGFLLIIGLAFLN